MVGGHGFLRVALSVLAASVVACGGDAGVSEDRTDRPDAVDARLSVYVVNYPLAYFAERIGGDRVDVRFPAPPDVDPAFWQPDVETIAETWGLVYVVAAIVIGSIMVVTMQGMYLRHESQRRVTEGDV